MTTITISAHDGRKAAAIAALTLTGDAEGALIAADGNTIAVITALTLVQAIAQQTPELDPDRWTEIHYDLRRRAADLEAMLEHTTEPEPDTE